METVTFTLYTYWASYLFNGDGSGLEEQDLEDADSFVAMMVREYGSCIPADMEEESHFSRPDYPHNALLGDVAEYTFIYNPEEVS